MTYRELAAKLLEMTTEQQESNVTFLDKDGEYLPINKLNFTEETDVLDRNHPYLTIAENP